MVHGHALLGTHGRVGGTGQEYEVVGIVDDTFALIHAKRWDERVTYRIEEIKRDAWPVDTSRFEALVGEHRSIGPDGPTYLILKILDNERALICILESDREVPYPIEDILLDPGPDAAWKNR
jgi:hypothetical protein